MLNFYDIDKDALHYLLLLHIDTKHECPPENIIVITSVLITCIRFKSKL